MRRSALLLCLLCATLAVAACGSTRETTVVARPGSTVVVPDDNGHTKVITPG
jgi:ABC-type Fe3+-citrate transport system substrate-binding protein